MTVGFRPTDAAPKHQLKPGFDFKVPPLSQERDPSNFESLPTPSSVIESSPLCPFRLLQIAGFRHEIADIIQLRSQKWVVIVGPCSIHDPVAAFEYANRLSALSRSVSDVILLVMRVYFEKPRTTVGWKGLINDPYLDGSCVVGKGITIARNLLLEITDLSLPVASEFLDPFTPSYFADTISWGAIGARTCESQVHRELAANLPMPIGFKNGTEGCCLTAIEAVVSAASPHALLGMSNSGTPAVFKTMGNQSAHLVLRGGRRGPNFDANSVAESDRLKLALGVRTATIIDCSHGNSGKEWQNQSTVLRQVLREQLSSTGSWSTVRGVMLESNIEEGRQDIEARPLKYGVSVTDGCIGWAETESLIIELALGLRCRVGAFPDEDASTE